ncbi:MAG: class I SAM-dependent methyltransferase [Pirellulales bacterium]|nr:class I SAM-dependent methyltransferase [Pirellulales bacterium]
MQRSLRFWATVTRMILLLVALSTASLIALAAEPRNAEPPASAPDNTAPDNNAAAADDAPATPLSADTDNADPDVGDADEKLPPPLKRYKGRRIAPYMTWHGAVWLTRPERAQEEQTDKLLAALKIKPGQTVCDLGCGNGYYTLELARLVGPQGKVLAVDIQPEMLHLLDLRVKEAGLANVEPIQSTPIDPKLPPASCDLILVVDVYHEFGYPEQMLAALHKALKPDGRLVLVEFRAEDLLVPIKPEHKMSKRQVLKELEPNGYELAEQYDDLSWQHVMFFRQAEKKPGDKQEAK